MECFSTLQMMLNELGIAQVVPNTLKLLAVGQSVSPWHAFKKMKLNSWKTSAGFFLSGDLHDLFLF
jgi:hypothetical protein